MDMGSKSLIDVLERAKTWPPEDQEELVAYAREIEARHAEVYVMTADERAAVEEGLAQAERGEFVPDEEVEAFWKRVGARDGVYGTLGLMESASPSHPEP
jgi:predicted transcriptional regulator